MTARSRPIDQKHLAYQTYEIYWCFDVVGISDDRLRESNDQGRSGVRSMPLSLHGHVWKWNTCEQAQIFTVICCDELHGRGIAITSAETCARYLIVGLRKYVGFFFGAADRLVLIPLWATFLVAAGCGCPNAAPAPPSLDVAGVSGLPKDVPIVSELVATLDGHTNAQIQPP